MSGLEQVDPEKCRLPTRVVEVTENGTFLREASEMADPSGPYVILSHRWGAQTGASSTLEGNYSDRKAGIWDPPLTKTFQDAITYSQRVGIPRIWIDSLCIIQEQQDMEDWKKEATMMGSYYQNAIFTLVATSGSDEHGLVPDDRFDSSPRIARLPYRDRTGQVRGLFYLYALPESYHREDYRKHVLGSELLSRGWVFQEWLLSRRVVCITPIGTVFECQSRRPQNCYDTKMARRSEPPAQVSEFPKTAKTGDSKIRRLWNLVPTTYQRLLPGDSGSVTINTPSQTKRPSPADKTLIIKERFDLDGVENCRIWSDIVTAYSRLGLTYRRDNLVALSGIAKEFLTALRSRNTGDTPILPSLCISFPGSSHGSQSGMGTRSTVYASGLWLRDIHYGLLWQPVHGELPAKYRILKFPTWSWMSLESAVSWEWAECVARMSAKQRGPIWESTFDLTTTLQVLKLGHDEPPDTKYRGVEDPSLSFPCPQADLTATTITRLQFLGHVADVRVGNRFEGHTYSSYYGYESCKALPSSASKNDVYRAIAHPGKIDTACGWGIFEHPDLANESWRSSMCDESIKALAVVTMRNFLLRDAKAFGPRYTAMWPNAYIVLYIKYVTQDQAYQRIGMGLVWGEQIMGCFSRDARERVMIELS